MGEGAPQGKEVDEPRIDVVGDLPTGLAHQVDGLEDELGLVLGHGGVHLEGVREGRERKEQEEGGERRSGWGEGRMAHLSVMDAERDENAARFELVPELADAVRVGHLGETTGQGSV